MITSIYDSLVFSYPEEFEKHDKYSLRRTDEKIAKGGQFIGKYPERLQILKLIKDFKIITTQDIARIVYKSKKPATAKKNAWQNLDKMWVEYGLIDKFEPTIAKGKGTASHHWMIDEFGWELLHKEKPKKGIINKQLSTHWRHTSKIAEMYSHIYTQLEVIAYDKRTFKYGWDGSKEVIPDLVFWFKHNGNQTMGCLEIDMGTEKHDYLIEKIKNYLQMFEHRFTKPWPPVFFFMNNRTKGKRLQEYLGGELLHHQFFIRYFDEPIMGNLNKEFKVYTKLRP